jgi:hypothetical protein
MKQFIFAVFFCVGFSGISQCSVNPFIENNYELCSKFLALREILSNPSDPDYDNPFLPESRVTPYLEKLSAIYENPNNEPIIDSLFNEFMIRVNQEYNYSVVYKMMVFSVDTNVPWVQNFKDTGISGIAALDNLMSTYQFSIESYLDLQTCSCTHFRIITSFDFLNVHALINDFEQVIDINIVETYFPDFLEARFNYQGIPYQINFESVTTCDIVVDENQYTFCLYAGDCPAGCLYSKCWTVEVSVDCSVVILLDAPEISFTEFAIYPHPASDVISLYGVTSEIYSILIYSVTGKLVLTSSSALNQIDISHLRSGIYFLEIYTSEGNKQIQKFIKN